MYTPDAFLTPKSIRVQFILPSSKEMDTLQPLMKAFFTLIDNVSKVKLSANAKEKAKKARSKAASRAYKANGIDEKRLAREAKAEEDALARKKWLESLPPEKRRKQELKDEKRAMRKRMKHGVMRVR